MTYVPSLPPELWRHVALCIQDEDSLSFSQADLVRFSLSSRGLWNVARPLLWHRICLVDWCLGKPNTAMNETMQRVFVDATGATIVNSPLLIDVMKKFPRMRSLRVNKEVDWSDELCEVFRACASTLKEFVVVIAGGAEPEPSLDFGEVALTKLQVTMESFLEHEPFLSLLRGRSGKSLRHLSLRACGFPLDILNLSIPSLTSLTISGFYISGRYLAALLKEHCNIEDLCIEGSSHNKIRLRCAGAVLPYLRRLRLKYVELPSGNSDWFWTNSLQLSSITLEEVDAGFAYRFFRDWSYRGAAESVQNVVLSLIPGFAFSNRPALSSSEVTIFMKILHNACSCFPNLMNLTVLTRMNSLNDTFEDEIWRDNMSKILHELSEFQHLLHFSWDLLVDGCLSHPVATPEESSTASYSDSRSLFQALEPMTNPVKTPSFYLNKRMKLGSPQFIFDIPDNLSPLQCLSEFLQEALEKPVPEVAHYDRVCTEDERSLSLEKRSIEIAESCQALLTVRWVYGAGTKCFKVVRSEDGVEAVVQA